MSGAAREVGLLPLTVREGQIVRDALYWQAQAAATCLADDLNCVDRSADNRWAAEEDIANAAQDLAVLTQQLAILGRSVDDQRDYRRGDMTLLTDDGHEDVTVQIPVADLRLARDALQQGVWSEEAARRLGAWIERGEDQ